MAVGLMCIGPSSEQFIRSMCDTIHRYHAEDEIALVGVHPSGGNGHKTVDYLTNKPHIRAMTVDYTKNTAPEIFALKSLLDAFNEITVSSPELLVLAFDEEYAEDLEILQQSWELIKSFKTINETKTKIVAVYFTSKTEYPISFDGIFDSIKAQVLPLEDTDTLLMRTLLVSENASLAAKFAGQFRDILARQLAIMLIAQPEWVTVKFLSQMRAIARPFVGMAFDMVETPQIDEWTTALKGELSDIAVEKIAKSLTDSLIELLNMPIPRASFDQIRPETRRHAQQGLTVNIFTPLLPVNDVKKLQGKMAQRLSDYGIDAQGVVIPKPRSPSTPPQPPVTLEVFKCPQPSIWPLSRLNEVLANIPGVGRIAAHNDAEKTCQIQIFFGIEEP